ncbi:tetratricopeptide repeat protein [Magnetospira thiophila]
MTFIALTVILSAPAQAGVAEGLAAVESGDYETALKEFSLAATHGDPEAAYNMGALYQLGQGVERSEAEALKYYRQAATGGSRDGQFALGSFYHRGKGWLQKDPDQAVYWYEKAAEQGSIAAQYNLGMMFATGEGVAVAYGSNPDYVKAFSWFSIVRRNVETDEDRAKVDVTLGELKEHMTDGQLARANELVEDWWGKFGK